MICGVRQRIRACFRYSRSWPVVIASPHHDDPPRTDRQGKLLCSTGGDNIFFLRCRGLSVSVGNFTTVVIERSCNLLDAPRLFGFLALVAPSNTSRNVVVHWEILAKRCRLPVGHGRFGAKKKSKTVHQFNLRQSNIWLVGKFFKMEFCLGNSSVNVRTTSYVQNS